MSTGAVAAADGEITTRQLLQRAKSQGLGISYGTLRYYTYLGLIAKPRKVSGGRGKGVKGYYPLEVLEWVRRIRQLQSLGLTLAEIRRRFTQEVEIG